MTPNGASLAQSPLPPLTSAPLTLPCLMTTVAGVILPSNTSTWLSQRSCKLLNTELGLYQFLSEGKKQPLISNIQLSFSYNLSQSYSIHHYQIDLPRLINTLCSGPNSKQGPLCEERRNKVHHQWALLLQSSADHKCWWSRRCSLSVNQGF